MRFGILNAPVILISNWHLGDASGAAQSSAWFGYHSSTISKWSGGICERKDILEAVPESFTED